MAETGGGEQRPMLIVVRVGALGRFAALQEAFGSEGVDVVWDRRVGDRRRPGGDDPVREERRRRERRGPPPASWALLDFLVVPTSPRAS
jgi:hypothetical protein